VKQLPIRLRLTLWYSIMFAGAALLLSATSWWMLRNTIDTTVHHDLQERVDDVRTQLQQLALGAARTDIQTLLDATYRYRDDGKWLQIRRQDGLWIYRSRRMEQQNVPLAISADLPDSDVQTEFEQGGRTVRAISSRVVANGVSYSVQTGMSMAKSQLLLRKFGMGLLLMTPAVLLVAAGAGHFLSRKALLPVAAIAYEARRITDRNLDSRLPVSASNDELSHLSTTLNHMLARIDSSFRSVRDFTANASHELRTPLTRIRTEAEIALFLQRQRNEYEHSLRQIHQDTIEMSALIDNLLTLARAEAGREILRMLPVDLHSLVADVVNEWAGIADKLFIRMSTTRDVQAADGHQSIVLADRTTLVRLLRIWLDNACKFTPAGGSIVIHTQVRDETVVLAVEDSGIGIAPEEHERIFQRFYRVDSASSRAAGGAGLGLSLAAWIAEQHKTRIRVRSTPEQGTRLEITLPRTHPGRFFEREVTRQSRHETSAESAVVNR
jgi:signal transduction histidine kinase